MRISYTGDMVYRSAHQLSIWLRCEPTVDDKRPPDPHLEWRIAIAPWPPACICEPAIGLRNEEQAPEFVEVFWTLPERLSCVAFRRKSLTYY